MESRSKKVVELFPQQGRGTTLRTGLWETAERIDGVVAELRDELPASEAQRLGHRFGDLDDVVIFLRALAGS